MRIFLTITTFLAVFDGINLQAQDIDTVVIVLDPLVVKRSVLIQERVAPQKAAQDKKLDLSDWWVCLGYRFGKLDGLQTADSIQKSFSVNKGPSLMLGHDLESNWNLGIGLAYSRMNMTATYTDKWVVVDTVLQQHIDSVRTGVVISPEGGVVYKYRYDTTYAPGPRHTHHEAKVSAIDQISYWQIPLYVSYKMAKGRLYALPNMVLSYHFTTQAGLFKDRKNIPLPKHYLSATFGLQLGFKVWKHVALEAGMQYMQQFRNAYRYIKQNQSVANVAVKYMF